jgi:hypothetical protein
VGWRQEQALRLSTPRPIPHEANLRHSAVPLANQVPKNASLMWNGFNAGVLQ